MKFFGGVITGIFLSFVGLLGLGYYVSSPGYQLNKCMAQYSDLEEKLSKDPQTIEAMKLMNVSSVHDLIRARCQTWIDNGQKF